jgi:anti-sigma factor ChrR (cupin superfamily)
VKTSPPPDVAHSELPQDRALRRGAERLSAAVSELPVRYAPFYGRLATLWELGEADVVRELERARHPGHWRRTLLPGLRTFQVSSRSSSGRSRLLSFAPGLTFPSHRHQGQERVLVLEGSYRDDQGAVVEPGDEQLMLPGSTHSLFILGDKPCVAAVSERGISFIAPWIDRLLGR